MGRPVDRLAAPLLEALAAIAAEFPALRLVVLGSVRGLERVGDWEPLPAVVPFAPPEDDPVYN